MEEPVACEVCAQLVWGTREGAGVSEHKHAQGILFRHTDKGWKSNYFSLQGSFFPLFVLRIPVCKTGT